MKKSGYDPKDIARIEAETTGGIKEKLSELAEGTSEELRPFGKPDRLGKPVKSVMSDNTENPGKRQHRRPLEKLLREYEGITLEDMPNLPGKGITGAEKPVKVSVEEILEKYGNVILEDIPLLSEAPERRTTGTPTAFENKPVERALPEKTGREREHKSRGSESVSSPMKKSGKDIEADGKPCGLQGGEHSERREASRKGKSGSGNVSRPADLRKTPDFKKGHRSRVRQRFIETGFEGFAPHEIMEFLLFYTLPRRDTKDIGHELIHRFGSVADVLDGDPAELVKVPFVTERTVRLFRLITALADYEEPPRPKRPQDHFDNCDKIIALFEPFFKSGAADKLYTACFFADLRLIAVLDAPLPGKGYTNETFRMIADRLVNTGCAMAAVAHCRIGSDIPTNEDIEFTRSLGKLMGAMDIGFLDHVIFGSGEPFSMRRSLDWKRLTGESF